MSKPIYNRKPKRLNRKCERYKCSSLSSWLAGILIDVLSVVYVVYLSIALFGLCGICGPVYQFGQPFGLCGITPVRRTNTLYKNEKFIESLLTEFSTDVLVAGMLFEMAKQKETSIIRRVRKLCQNWLTMLELRS